MAYKAPGTRSGNGRVRSLSGNLPAAKDQVMTKGGNTPKTYVDYRRSSRDPSIDASSSPSRTPPPRDGHGRHQGRQEYLCGKTLAHTIEEGSEIVEGPEIRRIIQVGTQNRSNSLYIKAKEMVARG